MAEINITEHLMRLVEETSSLSTHVGTVQHDITSIKQSLERVSSRIDNLEKAEGDKYKENFRIAKSYIIAAVVSAIMVNLPNIISSIAK